MACHLKQLLKSINAIYYGMITVYKMDLIKLNSFSLKQTAVEFAYDQFMRTNGIKNLSEKKFAQTISAVMRFKDQITRVKLFGRFLGLFDDLDKESFKLYLACVSYMQNVSSFGYLVPFTDSDEIHYTPYIRFIDFMRVFLENRITPDEFQEVKLQVDKLKEHDFKKNRNLFVLDLDKAVEILINSHLDILNQKKSSVQDIFLAFDFDQMELIDYPSFYLIMKYFDDKGMPYKEIKDLFEYNSELIAINSVKKESKKCVVIDQFISICFSEKLFTRESQ